MPSKPINEVLAENLRHFMDERGLKQPALSSKSGVAQTTISLYLRPSERKPGAKGKMPSAKLAEVEQLADALGVRAWELLRPLTPQARAAYAQIEAAFLALNPTLNEQLGEMALERTGTHD